MQTLNLSKEERVEQLNLRKNEVAQLCLTKPTLNGLTSRVALVLDYSGSMSSLYENGTVQSVVEKVLPIAMNFDDNGTMEMWIFENGFRRLEDISLKNFYGYVENNIMKYRMGGTCFAPVMEDIFNRYIKEDPANLPNYVIFITDGENSDKAKTNDLIKKLSKYPIFFQFIGIGNCDFRYLSNLDKMEGRYVDNANFFAVRDVDTVSYDMLLNEYPSWLADEKVKQMIAEQGKGNESLNENAPKKRGLFGRLFG